MSVSFPGAEAVYLGDLQIWPGSGDAPWAKVSGGTATEYTKPDGSVMEVHTFTANGTLICDTEGRAEILVVGPGATTSSNGNGGPVLLGQAIIPAGSHTVTIGVSETSQGGGGDKPTRLGSVCGAGVALGASDKGNDGLSATANGVVSTITGASHEYGAGGSRKATLTAAEDRYGIGGDPAISNRAGGGFVVVAVQKSPPTVSGIVASGGTEDTFVGDGNLGQIGVTYKRHRFDADGTLTVTQSGEATLVLIGAGGTTGHNNTAAEQIGAGAGGGVLIKTVTLPAGALPVAVGVAGAQGRALPGGPTYVGEFFVPGGGPGSSNRNGPGGDGGCGGGGGDGTGVGGKGIPGVGHNGGNGGGSPDGGGGGGAGGPGVGPVGGPGRTLWGVEYGKGGSVVSTGLGTAPVANSGSGESISQGNNSRILAANGRAFIFYPVA
jgi:hypothetical protein